MKKFKCSECGEINTIEEWDRKTISVFEYPQTIYQTILDGEDLSYYYFCCPSCSNSLSSVEEVE